MATGQQVLYREWQRTADSGDEDVYGGLGKAERLNRFFVQERKL
jgi:hypothetical protein